ncbi:MAG: hypothetical protein IPM74_08535 [Crocinitomicaceae bacterium]|nr:hypothetical protein [Crocinitomicaceae bacterium]
MLSFDFLAGSTVPAPIPNGSFENWTYETIEVPSDWFSFDEFFYPTFGTQYATKSSGQHHKVLTRFKLKLHLKC